MEIAAAAAVTALERNVALVLVPPIKDPSTALSTIPFDGAVLVEPAADDPYLDMLRNRGLPSVVIGPPPDEKDPWVRVDNHQIAELLVDHMIEVGATNFPLLVGRSMRRSNVIFRETYVARCSAAGLPVRIIEIDETDAENAAEAAILREIDEGNGLDGVVASIDATASGAMSALRARGLSVPDDVKVVTRYDGFRARSENPSLTALNLRLDEIAQIAANSLLDVLEGKELSGPIDAPPPLLVVRGSTVKGM
ncbi:substrate-binding domain-containing protein [Salipiger pallidus]